MMMNLFSIFDPSLYFFSLSWLVVLFCFLLLPTVYWVQGFFHFLFYKMVLTLVSEVSNVIKNPKKGIFKYLFVLFIYLLICNFFSIFPFIFCVTSHMFYTFPMAYSMWFSVVAFSLWKSVKMYLSHLIPVGTPVFLISFMVVVEVLSNLIRPMALTFRLTANMMAGHLLMSLIGNVVVSLPFIFMFFGSFMQSLLVFMELGVSFIQAYVFSMLLLLYISESEYEDH